MMTVEIMIFDIFIMPLLMMTDSFFVHDDNDVNEDGVTMIKAMETKRTRIC